MAATLHSMTATAQESFQAERAVAAGALWGALWV